ncbi:Undecaprenyl phosphate-aminoarabinose flippase subunit ArnF [Thalassovita gelatinovora]|uniref:Undecaprenyl phosphate-aminoarabinose flippase subunit ArnF n=1 Tax=Thalassovita gelatinovora TaxID=53501 RepID=A0A0P1FBS5_THAGE|nr:EamA family transporter [Thalassovita gelatinovora]QIZ80089.1 EamA family transporter [Thalassovita gelatinovora]CUH65517.1 Undecaprenyl phosphate-aminoarabinose flippase subunit ArnF [Thalassovita gelatinovora]SER08371.1 EamA-like transporter family protein [Thalassovita gelatinovora]
MTLPNFVLVIASVILSAMAQTSFKHGVSRVVFSETAGLVMKVMGMLFSPFVLLGLALYGVSVVLWLFALRQLDLSLAYPFVSISFVLVVMSGILVLGEPANPTRLTGIGLIVLGLLVMARGA